MLDTVADSELKRFQEQLREDIKSTRGVSLEDGHATFGGVTVPPQDVEQGGQESSSVSEQATVVPTGKAIISCRLS
jgi:hypothetical protein